MKLTQIEMLERLRARLDAQDRRIVAALAGRQRLVEAIARVKGDPARVRDPARVEAVLANVLRASALVGLSPAIAEPVWRELVERCAEHEAALLVDQPAGPDSPHSCCGCEGPAGT